MNSAIDLVYWLERASRWWCRVEEIRERDIQGDTRSSGQSCEYGVTKVFRVHRREDWRGYKMHRQNSKYPERAAFDSSRLWSAYLRWNHVRPGKNCSKGLEEISPGMHKGTRKSACSHHTGKHYNSWYRVMYPEVPCLSSEKL